MEEWPQEPEPMPQPEPTKEPKAAKSLDEAIKMAGITKEDVLDYAVKATEFVIVTVHARKVRVPRAQ